MFGSHPSFLTIFASASPFPNVTGSPLMKSLCSNITLNVGKSCFLITLPALLSGSNLPPVLPIPVRVYWILESAILLFVIVKNL